MPDEVHRFTASLVTQGTHRFYTLTMPSDVLAKTCFVSTRDEDPKAGFQRLLDKKRALEVADYIDKGLGTIPTSIILSAQESAGFAYTPRLKAVEFKNIGKAFLIIDGQHRVYGFSLATAALRVPVVIYEGLSRRDETRLFIDINTKQRPVSNELLLDIKHLAEYENDAESRLRRLFDAFNSDVSGPLYGLLSQSSKRKGKVSRVTFNASVKPLLKILGSVSDDEAQLVISAYLIALRECMLGLGVVETLTAPVVFKAVMRVFPDVARKVKDRHGSSYTQEHFSEILDPAFSRAQAAKFSNPGNSVEVLYEHIKRCMESDFQL